MKKFFKIVGILLIVVIVLAGAGFTYLMVAFPKVSAAPELKIEPTPERIERGKFLANSFAFCIDCHSDRDINKFSMPVVPGTEGRGGMDFGEDAGFVPASNITPDKETGIGSWTDGEIFRAITSGVKPDGSFLAPMMPYPMFAQMDKEDLYAIIAYIKTLPAINNKVPEKKLKFPVNVIFRTIPSDVKEFGKRPDGTDKIKLGEYYGAACKFCHSQSDKGEFIPGKEFAGGVEFPMPDGTIIRSSNITPDKETGIGTMTKEIFLAKFRACADANNLDPKSRGFNTPMAWNFIAKTASDDDLSAIYDYLMKQPPVSNKVEKLTMQGVK
ncbi:MAG TPA: cytochrome C [Ignavibacteria bacterium]|mgnify:FL=1|nr:cytochrome C [Ignavibacteria bacterium]